MDVTIEVTEIIAESTISETVITCEVTIGEGISPVQSDWTQTDNAKLDFIKNKPTIPTATTDLTNDSGFITNSDLAPYATNEALQSVSDAVTAIEGELPNLQPKTDNTLETVDKTVAGAINEVNSIAKGANQALAFNNYQAVIAAMFVSGLNEGQNLYVDTLDVPDLWIKTVELTSVAYAYTTDDQFITDILAGVQIGYYKLALLETQKVDLTNYYNKGEVDTLLGGKSDVGHDHSGEVIVPDAVTIAGQYTDTQAADLAIGTIFYNTDQKCYMQKIAVDVYHNFGSELPSLSKIGDNTKHLNGMPVYITSGAGNLNVVSLATSAIGKADAMATQDILNTGDKTGFYCYFGNVHKFPRSNVIKSTDNAANWIEGAELHLCSEAGKLSTEVEAAPAKCPVVARITAVNGSNITLHFIPNKAVSVSDLSDVDGTDTTIYDTDVLLKKDASVWKKITWANVKTLLATWADGLYVTLSQNVAQTIGSTTKRILKSWHTDIDSNKIITAKIVPQADGTSAIAIYKANGTTLWGRISTTSNEFVTIGAAYFENGNVSIERQNISTAYDGVLTFRNSSTSSNSALAFYSKNIEFFRGLPDQSVRTVAGKYQYNDASPAADTINDTRTSNKSGATIYERCTVANATTKGSGTWVVKSIEGAEKALTNNVSANILDINCAVNTMQCGIIEYSISAIDTASNTVRSHIGYMNYNVRNQNGVITTNLVHSATLENDLGTISDTWALTNGTNKATLSLTANASGMTPTSMTLYFDVKNQGKNTIVLL